MSEAKDLAAYREETHEFRMQQAGLELVNHIRRRINDENARRRYCGDYDVEKKIYFFRAIPPPSLRGGALEAMMQHKDLEQLNTLLVQLLLPYVLRGKVPAYRMQYGESVRAGASYIMLSWDMPMPTPSQ